MKRTGVTIAVVIVLALALVYLFFFRHSREHASIILTNGVVYTVSDAMPKAEAIAIKDDRILAVGSSKEIAARYMADSVFDLRGRAVYPGFIDAHAHLESLGATLVTLNLTAIHSSQEACSLVAQAVLNIPPGQWLRGRGWDQNKWEEKTFPGLLELDKASPAVPVVLTRIDGHALWVNSQALKLAGVTAKTPDPPGGKIVRDSKGNPTGILIDNAMGYVLAALPSPTEGERSLALQRAVQMCLSVGLTEVQDMGVELSGIALMRKLMEEGKFELREYGVIEGTGETWQNYITSGPDTGSLGGRLTVRALKLYADGALGSRGAALVEPYSDDPPNRGLTTMSSGDMLNACRDALDRGFQVCVHAIGDRANNIVLNVYEETFNSKQFNGINARFRVEHAQILLPGDIPRFKKLGVLPSMQPTHCTSDMPWAEARLGAKRLAGAYAWRSLLDGGNIIPAGSDFPVESPNPLLGFYAAITRQDISGYPTGGWHPEQRMTREEALKSFTLWGAYAAFQENVKGSIESGKWADIVVLSDDIMALEPSKIPGVKVQMTMVGGKIAYRDTVAGWAP